jgi:hypothetical protein
MIANKSILDLNTTILLSLLAFVKIAVSLIMLSFSIIGNYNPFLRIGAFLLGLLVMFI